MAQLDTVLYTAAAHTTGGRDGASRLCMCALGVAIYASAPALAHTQNVPFGRHAVPTLSKEPTRAQLKTQDVPLDAPALRAAAEAEAIRPFRVAVPEADLVDLRRRIAATRWPDRETVADQSQGVQLATLQELVRYWGTDYDWRKA